MNMDSVYNISEVNSDISRVSYGSGTTATIADPFVLNLINNDSLQDKTAFSVLSKLTNSDGVFQEATGITNANGERYATFSYGADGKAIESTLAPTTNSVGQQRVQLEF